MSPGILSLGRGNFFHFVVCHQLPFHLCFYFFALSFFSFSGKLWQNLDDNRHFESFLFLSYRVAHIPRESKKKLPPTKFRALDDTSFFLRAFSFVLEFHSLLTSKFRIRLLLYYFFHNKFIVRWVIIMPSRPTIPNDIMTKSFVTAETEKRGSSKCDHIRRKKERADEERKKMVPNLFLFPRVKRGRRRVEETLKWLHVFLSPFPFSFFCHTQVSPDLRNYLLK